MHGLMIAGKYRLNLPLASGTMGEVWSATNTLTERQVAIKFLSLRAQPHSPDRVRRFLQEAKVSARINHPNIVDVLDVGQTETGRLFLVMELLTGISLETALRRQTPRMTLYEIALVMIEVASALGAAHASGIIHRDLKPSNIFLHKVRDGVVIPKVLDFGVGKFVSGEAADATLPGTILGSPFYMSPEQARGEQRLDGRSDIFAFGGILFEALCGYRAYEANQLGTAPARQATPYGVVEAAPYGVGALIVAIATGQPRSIDLSAPHVPDSFRRVVRRCLEPDLRSRARDFAEVIVMLRQAMPDLEAAPKHLPPPMMPSVIIDPDATDALPVLGASERLRIVTELGLGRPSSSSHLPLAFSRSEVPSDPPPVPEGWATAGRPAEGSMSPPHFPPPLPPRSPFDRTRGSGVGVPPESLRVPLGLERYRERRRWSASSIAATAVTVAVVGGGIGALAAFRPRAATIPGPLGEGAGDSALASPAAARPVEKASGPEGATPASALPDGAPPTISIADLPGSMPAARGLRNAARLELTATPGWCAIAVDGKPRGPTPLAALEVPAGEHRISCITPDGKERTAILDAAGGATEKYLFILDE
jgi:eukaryotic-like serine/threonine-protein kinase